MAKAAAIHVESAERTPLLTRMRWGFNRARRAVLPRRWVIRLEMRDNSRIYAKEIAQARARNASRDDIEGIRSAEASEYWTLEEELEMLESSRLLRTAKRLMLPTPEFKASDDDPNWRQGTNYKPTWFLQPEAMRKLRDDIRAERRARREPIVEWMKFVGSAGGAVYLLEKVIGLLNR